MDRVCPLLGLEVDRRTTIDGADPSHRCHAQASAVPIDRVVQSRLCLTDTHPRCDRYLAYAARHDGRRPGRSSVADGLVTTRLVLAPEPAWRGIAGRARRARSGSAAAVIAGAAALGIGGVALATGVLDEPRAEPPGEAAVLGASAAATPTWRATAAPTLAPTPTPPASAVASTTPPATVAPSATPAPAPAPPVVQTPPPAVSRTYTVSAGDTLASIAATFGTSAAAIQNANGIDDPDEILVGQVLVIP